MKGSYDGSVTVTTTRAMLLASDPNRKSVLINAGATNRVYLSTRQEDGSGGLVLQPLSAPVLLKAG